MRRLSLLASLGLLLAGCSGAPSGYTVPPPDWDGADWWDQPGEAGAPDPPDALVVYVPVVVYQQAQSPDAGKPLSRPEAGSPASREAGVDPPDPPEAGTRVVGWDGGGWVASHVTCLVDTDAGPVQFGCSSLDYSDPDFAIVVPGDSGGNWDCSGNPPGSCAAGDWCQVHSVWGVYLGVCQ